MKIPFQAKDSAVFSDIDEKNNDEIKNKIKVAERIKEPENLTD